jgi:molybdate transport system substrate-binding protein
MMSPSYAKLLVATALLLGFGGPGAVEGARQNAIPRVAAASDLKFALDDVAQRFEQESGANIEIVYGASGALTRQLIEGAPFDLFLSADEAFVYQLADAGLTRDRGLLYAIGRIVIFAPRGSPLLVDPALDGLRDLLGKGRVTRFAIANPAVAPYGRAAQAVLRTKNLWADIQPRLVLGDNVAQAAQFATTGGAVGGIIAYSHVLAPPLRTAGTYALIPVADHPPLRQRMVLMKRAGMAAERFYEYVQRPRTRDILKTHGFSLPD